MPNYTQLVLATAVAMVAVCGSSQAARPLPGYQCLALNMTTVEASDPNFMLTVRQGPSDQSPVLGTSGALLVAADPVFQKNGFVQIIRPNAQIGWVPASSVKPWRSPNPAATNIRCYPEILDNGRVGFTTR